MLIGVAQTDITPEVGGELSGFVARVQPAVGVQDRLYARALHVQVGDARLLWVHCDLVGLAREFVLTVKRSLRALLGLEPHEIVLTCTHTHSGPATVRLLNCGEPDSRYLERLANELVNVATGAQIDADDAELVWGEGRCTVGVDRRGKAHQHTDPRVGVIAWRRGDGTYAAVLTNYAMHNVALGHENRLVSGDVAGAAARVVSAGVPGRPVVLCTNGGAGNINPPAVANDVGQMERWGGELGRAVLDALASARRTGDEALRTAACTVELPLQRLTDVQIAEIADRHRGYTQGKHDYASVRCREVFDYWQRHMQEVVRAPARPTAPLDLHVVRIGPLALACFSAEMFSCTADDLRAAANCPVYCVSYANGVLGYLPPPYAFDEGGYEVAGANLFYDALPLERGAYEVALAAARDGLRLVGAARGDGAAAGEPAALSSASYNATAWEMTPRA